MSKSRILKIAAAILTVLIILPSVSAATTPAETEGPEATAPSTEPGGGDPFLPTSPSGTTDPSETSWTESPSETSGTSESSGTSETSGTSDPTETTGLFIPTETPTPTGMYIPTETPVPTGPVDPTVSPTPTPAGFHPDTEGTGGFVARMYTVVLNREPEESGYLAWKEVLLSGKENGAKVAEGFLFSDEFINRKLSNGDYVKVLYNLFFDREPDEAGFNAWKEQLDNGVTDRKGILAGFVNSTEWANTCVLYGIESGGTGIATVKPEPKPTEGMMLFVRSLYSECLGREATDEEVQAWAKTLASHENTGKQVAYGFFFSDEFTRKAQNMYAEELVTVFYKVFLNREPDTAGLNAWVDTIYYGGGSVGSLFVGFSDSDEFKKKCVEYGVIPGESIAIPGVFTNVEDDFLDYVNWNSDVKRGIGRIDQSLPGVSRRTFMEYNVKQVDTIATEVTMSDRDVAAIEKFAADHFQPGWTDGMKFAYTAWWINRNVTYANSGDAWRAISGKGYAEAVFNARIGQCAQYNGAMVEMMVYMGYDASLVLGTRMNRSGSTFQHYWGEVNLNGVTYMFENGNMGDSGEWHFFICDYSETSKFVKNGTLMNW